MTRKSMKQKIEEYNRRKADEEEKYRLENSKDYQLKVEKV